MLQGNSLAQNKSLRKGWATFGWNGPLEQQAKEKAREEEKSMVVDESCPVCLRTTQASGSSKWHHRQRRRRRRLGTVASAAATIASLAVFTLNSRSGAGGGGSDARPQTSTSTVDAFRVPVPIRPRSLHHPAAASGATTTATNRRLVASEVTGHRRAKQDNSGGSRIMRATAGSRRSRSGGEKIAQNRSSHRERCVMASTSSPDCAESDVLALDMSYPEGIEGAVNRVQETGGTAIEDLDKMKLAELKVLYKEQGGKPRAMRKHELIQKLTDLFLLSGQQPQEPHDGREEDDGHVVLTVDEESHAMEIPMPSATAVAAPRGGETVTTASASSRNVNLGAKAETGAGEVGHLKHKEAAGRLNGHIVATDSCNLRSQNDLVTSSAAVVSEESGAVGGAAYPSGAGIVGSMTASSTSETTTRAPLTPQLSSNNALDPVTSPSLHESVAKSPRRPSSARGASATAEEDEVEYALHDTEPPAAGAVAAAARARALSAAAAAAAARVAATGRSTALVGARRHAHAVRARASNRWQQSTDGRQATGDSQAYILPTEVLVAGGSGGRGADVGAKTGSSLKTPRQIDGQNGAADILETGWNNAGGVAEVQDTKETEGSAMRMRARSLQRVAAEDTVSSPARSSSSLLHASSATLNGITVNGGLQDNEAGSSPASPGRSTDHRANPIGNRNDDGLPERALSTSREYPGQRYGGGRGGAKVIREGRYTSRAAGGRTSAGRVAANMNTAVGRVAGGNGNGPDERDGAYRPSGSVVPRDAGGRGDSRIGGSGRPRRMPRAYNPWAQADNPLADRWISGEDDDVVEEFLTATMMDDGDDEDRPADPVLSR